MQGFDHQSLRTHIEALAASVSWNEDAPALVTNALLAGEGQLTAHGALSVTTGVYTGRSVKDKFIVSDSLTRDRVWWENSAAI